MISKTIGDCTFDIIPIVKGLNFYSEEVKKALDQGGYDAADDRKGKEGEVAAFVETEVQSHCQGADAED